LRIHYLQHVPFEPLGSIAPWAERGGHDVIGTHVYAGDVFPEQDAFDALIVMGGPMSVNDEDRHPWMRGEKTFIERTLKEDKCVLGFCLGGQLIASAAGAMVTPNEYREIGWFPIKGTNGATGLFPEEAMVFHWHGERFELPAGAVHLASSEGCGNQAFLLNDKVLAMQFHMEFTSEIVAGLAERLKDEILEGGSYVQNTDTMLGDPQRFRNLKRLCFDTLDTFLGHDDGEQGD
jgi:GMP synthase-like glutamine amidotransferase